MCDSEGGYQESLYPNETISGDGARLSAWLRERFLVVDKNEQSAIPSCHFEEPFIFQCELKNQVACSDRNKERQKAESRSKTARCPQ
jgi:hypothetical protein